MLTQIDYLTPEKSSELIDKIKNPKYKVLILLMHDAGLRVSEAISLRMENFDFRKRIVTVKSLKKRGEKSRIIPISGRLYKAIADYLQKDKITEGYLFPSGKNDSGHITRFAASQMLIRFKKKNSGFANLHPHTLRHTFATNLLGNEANLVAIKDLLGHERMDTTTIYTHTPLEVIRHQIEKSAERKKYWYDKILNYFRSAEVETQINIQQKNSFVVGRRQELVQINTNIHKRINTIILGGIGTGKSILLENLNPDKKVLLIDDASDFKNTMINTLMHLFKYDKEVVFQMMYPQYDISQARIPLTKHSMHGLAKQLVEVTDKHEYTLIIDNVDRITPRVVKCLEILKDHFTIITTAREIPMNKSSFLWNFETIKLDNLKRGEALELIHRLSYDIETEDQELFRNHIWEQSSGNPRVVFELVERYRKEAFVSNDIVRQVRHFGSLPEIDMSFMILVVLGSLAILRYLAMETGESSLRFIGGAAMIVLLVFRQFFRFTKRKFIR